MEDRILLAHGSGGKLTHDLIEKNFVSTLGNPLLNKLDDSAVFELCGRLAFTTDSYTVSPIFFPGGDIGKLAVCGTVNDLAMSGAIPLYLSLSFIIEEGLPTNELEKIVNSICQLQDCSFAVMDVFYMFDCLADHIIFQTGWNNITGFFLPRS